MSSSLYSSTWLTFRSPPPASLFFRSFVVSFHASPASSSFSSFFLFLFFIFFLHAMLLHILGLPCRSHRHRRRSPFPLSVFWDIGSLALFLLLHPPDTRFTQLSRSHCPKICRRSSSHQVKCFFTKP